MNAIQLNKKDLGKLELKMIKLYGLLVADYKGSCIFEVKFVGRPNLGWNETKMVDEFGKLVFAILHPFK